MYSVPVGFSSAIALAASLYAVYLKIFNAISFILTPLPLIAAFGFMTGFMRHPARLYCRNACADLLRVAGAPPYIIHSRINFDAE